MDSLAFSITLARRDFALELALKVGAGETVAVIGRSGAGKTSLLRALAGLERRTSGRIALGADVWLDSDVRVNIAAEHRRVGWVPQDYGLLPHLTVERNVAFGARAAGAGLLERFGIAHLRGARPGSLSGGERQRVALARALARAPRLLLLDEPFAALDTVTRREVRDELADLLSGVAAPVLFVSHSFEDAAILADRIAVLADGGLVQLGTVDELRRAPADALVAALAGVGD